MLASGDDAMSLYEPPLSGVVATLVILLGVYAGVRGTRLLVRGLTHAGSLDVIRGVRGIVVAGAAAALAGGVLAAETGFVVLGAVFLAEELYETGVVALIIRYGEKDARGYTSLSH
jgi:hypothetical protein